MKTQIAINRERKKLERRLEDSKAPVERLKLIHCIETLKWVSTKNGIGSPSVLIEYESQLILPTL